MRLVVPQKYAYKSPMWITKISFSTRDKLGYWERGYYSNSAEIWKGERPGEEAMVLLKQAISRLNLSARAYHRILKVARSIADLAALDTPGTPHIAEAIQYRRLDASF